MLMHQPIPKLSCSTTHRKILRSGYRILKKAALQPNFVHRLSKVTLPKSSQSMWWDDQLPIPRRSSKPQPVLKPSESQPIFRRCRVDANCRCSLTVSNTCILPVCGSGSSCIFSTIISLGETPPTRGSSSGSGGSTWDP